MATIEGREWQPYRVGEAPKTKSWVNATRVPLETVFHVSHVSDAFRVFEDQKIRSTLVWDESKLRETRTSVAWLSPNVWSAGSRYGNISFAFDWRRLIEGERFYWVEAMKGYTPHAYRILITKKDLSLELTPYTPEDGDGPLFHDLSTDIWYDNREITGEFMIDRDLPLSECKSVGQVNHHSRYCGKDHSSCKDRGQLGEEAGAKLLARLVGQNILYSQTSLRRLFLNGDALHAKARNAWKRILRSFSKIVPTGTLSSVDSPASSIALAMLDMYGRGQSVTELGSLFHNIVEQELAVRYQAVEAFGIPLDKVPGSEDE